MSYNVRQKEYYTVADDSRHKQQFPTPIPVARALRAIGEDFAVWRKLRGLTEEQVADRAGVSRGTVRRLESGTSSVSLENMLRIARALGVLDEITGAVDPYSTDVGRLRSEEILPRRVRKRRG
jgi:transcriptional regulator with XRE-family HTH domain